MLVLFVLIALAVSVVPSAFAQGSLIVRSEGYAVQQSMDGGDPYAMTLLIAFDPSDPTTRVAVLLDKMQFVNVEHPKGELGLISGVLDFYSPDVDSVTQMGTVLSEADAIVASYGDTQKVYLGAQTLPAGSTWVTSYTGAFWTVDLRAYPAAPIDVPNAVWDWETLPIQVQNLTCPTTVSSCLFQSWDGIVGSRAWHVVVPAGLAYTSPFTVEGTWYQVSNVELADMPTLTARFAQMVEEVIVRDDPDPADDTKNMTVFKLWVGPTAPTDWTQVAMFDYSASIVDTGLGVTVKVATANVRDNPNADTANIVAALNNGTQLVAVSRTNVKDASGNYWLTVYWGDPRQYGYIRSDLVQVQDGGEIEKLPPIGQAGPGL